MIAIVCVDESNGILFNKRRVSRDKVLIQWIIKRIGKKTIWIRAYSKELFEGYDNIEVCDDYLDKAGLGDYCFVEDGTLAGYHNKLEAVLLCNWNRSYPSDVKFTIDLLNGDWEKYSTEEFVGNSHDKITVEEWMKNVRN